MHGAPDNYMVLPKENKYTNVDYGEFLTRLNYPSSINRSGEILHFQGFENGKESLTFNPGGDKGIVDITGRKSKTDGHSAWLQVGDNGLRLSSLQWDVPFFVTSKMGFEASFTLGHNSRYVGFEFWYYTAPVGHWFWIEYYPPTNELKLMRWDGWWEILDSNFNIFENINCWNTVKIVIDFNSNKYDEVFFNNRKYDVSSLDIPYFNWSGVSYIFVICALNSAYNKLSTGYFDDIVITVNEP